MIFLDIETIIVCTLFFLHDTERDRARSIFIVSFLRDKVQSGEHLCFIAEITDDPSYRPGVVLDQCGSCQDIIMCCRFRMFDYVNDLEEIFFMVLVIKYLRDIIDNEFILCTLAGNI
jgi:hypothetical protein